MTGLGTASGGSGSWAANWRYTRIHGTVGHRMLFTDVKGDCPNPFVGEDIDTYRFLVEGSAAIFGRKVELMNDAGPEYGDIAAREVTLAIDKFPEMGLVVSLPGGFERAIATHAHWLYYRDVAAAAVPELAWLVEGRSIHDTFYDNGWLGSSVLSHCSWELKTKPTRAWLDEHCDPDDTTVLIGMDWTETRRHAAVHHNYAHPVDKSCKRPAPKKGADKKLCAPGARVEGCCTPEKPCRGQRPCTNDDPCGTRLEKPWHVEMPMNDKPRIAKPQVMQLLREVGVRPPRMYSMGFQHSNCMGCVKAGQGHWTKVYEHDPVLYAYMEAREVEWQQSKPNRANNTHLKETAKDSTSESAALSLTKLRGRIESTAEPTLDMQFDFGGCVCGTGEKPGEEL